MDPTNRNLVYNLQKDRAIMLMTLLLLFYFMISLQIVFKPNKTIPLQFLVALFFSLYSFNYHSHLVSL